MLTQLEIEFAHTKHRWKIHEDVFGDEERVQLLNRCGGQLFGLFQNLLIYDTLAAICRICDPPKTRKWENNSIRSRFQKEKDELGSDAIKETEILLETLDEKMSDIRILRNKIIAHNDLDVANSSVPLPKVKYDEVDEVIDLIGKILNQICGTRGSYTTVTKFGPGIEKLTKILKAGEEQLNG